MQLLLRHLLRYLRVVGMDPTLQNRKSKILNFVVILSIVIVFVPYLEEIIWYFEGFESFKRFEFIGVPFWVLFINFTFLLKRQEILDLVALRDQFWSFKDFDEEIQNTVMKINRNTVKFIRLSMATFLLVPVVVIGVNLWIGNGQTFFLGYHQCTTTMCYTIQVIFQFLVIYFVCIPLVGTFALFFGSLVSETYCCLELLACSYKNITNTDGDLGQNLKNTVDQHILILRFTKIMDNMYRNVLLFVFFMFTVLFILFFNIIITSRVSLPVLIKYAPLRFDSLSRAVSEINWIDVGEKKVSFGKDVAFILMVAQQTKALTVGSVIPLNLNTFVKVLRVCYSVTTLIAAFQK